MPSEGFPAIRCCSKGCHLTRGYSNKTWGAFHSTKNPGNFGRKSNGTKSFQYKNFGNCGQPLEVVLFSENSETTEISRSFRRFGLECGFCQSRPWGMHDGGDAALYLSSSSVRMCQTKLLKSAENMWLGSSVTFDKAVPAFNSPQGLYSSTTCPEVKPGQEYSSEVGRPLCASYRVLAASSTNFYKGKILFWTSRLRLCEWNAHFLSTISFWSENSVPFVTQNFWHFWPVFLVERKAPMGSHWNLYWYSSGKMWEYSSCMCAVLVFVYVLKFNYLHDDPCPREQPNVVHVMKYICFIFFFLSWITPMQSTCRTLGNHKHINLVSSYSGAEKQD